MMMMMRVVVVVVVVVMVMVMVMIVMIILPYHARLYNSVTYSYPLVISHSYGSSSCFHGKTHYFYGPFSVAILTQRVHLL